MTTRHICAAIAMAAIGVLTASPALAEIITPIDQVQRGTNVTVQGTVERILDEDEFRLADASGRIEIYIGPNIVPANVGEALAARFSGQAAILKS